MLQKEHMVQSFIWAKYRHYAAHTPPHYVGQERGTLQIKASSEY